MKIDLNALVAERDALAAELKAIREQKPVAWITPARYGSALSFQKRDKPDDWNEEIGNWYCNPLYARPVPSRRLTNELISRLYRQACFEPNEMREAAEHFARAIESALFSGEL